MPLVFKEIKVAESSENDNVFRSKVQHCMKIRKYLSTKVGLVMVEVMESILVAFDQLHSNVYKAKRNESCASDRVYGLRFDIRASFGSAIFTIRCANIFFHPAVEDS